MSKLFTRLFSGRRQSPAAPEPSRPAVSPLKLLFFIIDWQKAHVVSDVFVEEKVRFHFICRGLGTASNEILDLLGIGAGDKAVVICLEQDVLVPILMKEVRKKLRHNSPGAGIAFTVPISSINDPVLQVFKQSIHKNEKIAEELELRAGRKTLSKARSESEGGDMADEFSHDLIVAIVNQGYSDELMNTAREAGATGGTVLNARGQAHEGAVKFFGISVQDEKELILLLIDRERKVNIMRAVCEAHGLNSKAQGIVFSLPVDNVMGLSFE